MLGRGLPGCQLRMYVVGTTAYCDATQECRLIHAALGRVGVNQPARLSTYLLATYLFAYLHHLLSTIVYMFVFV